jgi:hypothetical protein
VNNAQQRYEQCRNKAGWIDASRFLQIAEETGAWPPEDMLEWTIEHGALSSEDILRLAKALLPTAQGSHADRLYTLLISEWVARGPMADRLAEFAQATGVPPSREAVEAGLGAHLRKYGWAPTINAELLHSLETRLGLSIGRRLFDEVYDFYSSKKPDEIGIADYRAILHIAGTSGVRPAEDILDRVISRITAEGIRLFDDQAGPYGSWIRQDGAPFLEQFRRLKQGLPIDDQS